MTPGTSHFPFCAIEGQQALQRALLLLAVDPLLGGLLIEGPRGTAKSTSARALADVLPSGQWVNLPLGTSEEQLQGSLDLQAALQDAAISFKPGLLAQAHQGILYVDEVNLLPDRLVDLLLDVSASGINRVERDGVSHQHAARIALVGTMNPEEGQLRPQLLDRFGMYVRLPNVPDVATRKRIVLARMAFDADPQGFCQRHTEQQNALAAQLLAARANLDNVAWTDAVHDAVAELCQQAGVEGVRADLVMLRAARACAALAGRLQVELADVQQVAELALAHRRSADAQAPNSAGQAQQAEPPNSPPPSEPPPSAQGNSQNNKQGDAHTDANADAAPASGSPGADAWGGMAAPQASAIHSLPGWRPGLPKKA